MKVVWAFLSRFSLACGLTLLASACGSDVAGPSPVDLGAPFDPRGLWTVEVEGEILDLEWGELSEVQGPGGSGPIREFWGDWRWGGFESTVACSWNFETDGAVSCRFWRPTILGDDGPISLCAVREENVNFLHLEGSFEDEGLLVLQLTGWDVHEGSPTGEGFDCSAGPLVLSWNPAELRLTPR